MFGSKVRALLIRPYIQRKDSMFVGKNNQLGKHNIGSSHNLTWVENILL